MTPMDANNPEVGNQRSKIRLSARPARTFAFIRVFGGLLLLLASVFCLLTSGFGMTQRDRAILSGKIGSITITCAGTCWATVDCNSLTPCDATSSAQAITVPTGSTGVI